MIPFTALHSSKDVNSLMQEFTKRELSFYPIQSDNGKLKGVVERYQLFQSLQQFYQNKSGGQTLEIITNYLEFWQNKFDSILTYTVEHLLISFFVILLSICRHRPISHLHDENEK